MCGNSLSNHPCSAKRVKGSYYTIPFFFVTNAKRKKVLNFRSSSSRIIYATMPVYILYPATHILIGYLPLPHLTTRPKKTDKRNNICMLPHRRFFAYIDGARSNHMPSLPLEDRHLMSRRETFGSLCARISTCCGNIFLTQSSIPSSLGCLANFSRVSVIGDNERQ